MRKRKSIEFDGIQHFNNVFSLKSFNNIRKHDVIKNKYCVNNNINLVRISYQEIDEVDKILNKIIHI